MPFDSPDAFAAAWALAWNRRDVDAVLDHFAEDVIFSSPTAVATIGRPTVTGKAGLRSYWEAALAKVTTLHFSVARTLWAPHRRELAIIYDRHVNGHGDRAIELLKFGPAGLVVAGEVFYGVVPGSPAP